MSIPVTFADITKPVADLLSKEYPIGVTSLEVKTKTANGVTFTITGKKSNDTGLISGELKTTLKNIYDGATVNQTWTTSNELKSEVEVEDVIATGLSTKFTGSLLPATGNKSALLKAVYKHDHLHTTGVVDLAKSTITADAVVSSGAFLVGGEFAYDVQKGGVTRSNVAVGYSVAEWNASLLVQDSFKTFVASYFHRVNPSLEAGARATYKSAGDKSSAVNLELGSKYALDATSYAKVKINSSGILGLSYTQILRKGVKATLGSEIDTVKLNETSHKVGLALVLEN